MAKNKTRARRIGRTLHRSRFRDALTCAGNQQADAEYLALLRSGRPLLVHLVPAGKD